MSTSQNDRKPSIVDGNQAGWEAGSQEMEMTASRASRNAVQEVLNAGKHEQEQDPTEPEFETKRSGKRARKDPETTDFHGYNHHGLTKRAKMDPEITGSYGYNHQDLTSVPTRSHPQNRPYSQNQEPYQPGRLPDIIAGPSRTTPVYERCSECGTGSLPAENPAWQRNCKDCRQVLIPSQPPAYGTQPYLQLIVSPGTPLPGPDPCDPPEPLSQPYPPAFAASIPPGVLAYTGRVFLDGEDRMMNDFHQLMDDAGELVDDVGYLIDPVTLYRKLDVYNQVMWGRGVYRWPRYQVPCSISGG